MVARGSTTTTQPNGASTSLPPLPSAKRGSSLRVGKVITDARSVSKSSQFGDGQSHHHPMSGPPSAPVTMSRFIDEGEQRVQQEMIDMLSAKLAKKEKENELFRWQQEAIEAERSRYDAQVAQLDRELATVRTEIALKVEKLQGECQQSQLEAQQAQLQAERCRTEAEAQRVMLHELRRQREREGDGSRSREQKLERQLDALRRELSVTQAERQGLEGRVVAMQQQLRTATTTVDEVKERHAELDVLVAQCREQVQNLEQQLEVSRATAAGCDEQCRKLEQEKQSLETKVQQLTRNVREVTARVSDAERRKSNLTQTESQLAKQLTQLHRENEELKARNGQLLAQCKQQQTRLATLETTKSTLEANQAEASEEVELARKRCREYQFRVKQLQEEIVFLTKKKPQEQQLPAPLEGTRPQVIVASAAAVITPLTQEQVANDNVPSWMRT